MEIDKIVSPYFRIFDNPIEDDSISGFEYLEFRRVDSSDMNKGEHTIRINDENVYFLPHKAYLEVRGKLVKAADGSNYDAADAITLTNNGWSLFESIQYQMNENIVEDINLISRRLVLL